MNVDHYWLLIEARHKSSQPLWGPSEVWVIMGICWLIAISNLKEYHDIKLQLLVWK